MTTPKFAPIGPPHLLKGMRKEWGDGCLGDYHLVLAHDVVENYRTWENGQILPEGSTVIIDNSIIELGQPVSPEMMKEACKILGESYRKVVVLPDKFDDPEATYDQALVWLGEGYQSLDAEFMYVVQAKNMVDQTFRSIAGDLVHLVESRGVTWVSAPRRVADKFGTRMFMLHSLLQCKLRWPRLNIHLLGFSHNIQDDLYCTRQQGVEGIDSAVPVRLGQEDKAIHPYIFKGLDTGSRESFWEDPHKGLNYKTHNNLMIVRNLITYEGMTNLSEYRPKLKGEYI